MANTVPLEHWDNEAHCQFAYRQYINWVIFILQRRKQAYEFGNLNFS